MEIVSTQWATLKRMSENGPTFKSVLTLAQLSFTVRLLGCVVPNEAVHTSPSVCVSVCTIWHGRLGWRTGEDKMTKQKYLSNQRKRCKGPRNPFSGSRTLQGGWLILLIRLLLERTGGQKSCSVSRTPEKNCKITYYKYMTEAVWHLNPSVHTYHRKFWTVKSKWHLMN